MTTQSKTPEEISQQERAEEYALKLFGIRNSELYGDSAKDHFIAGENSGIEIGRRMEREELATKPNGFEEWCDESTWQRLAHADDDAVKWLEIWQAAQLSLLAKIKQLEAEIKRLTE